MKWLVNIALTEYIFSSSAKLIVNRFSWLVLLSSFPFIRANGYLFFRLTNLRKHFLLFQRVKSVNLFLDEASDYSKHRPLCRNEILGLRGSA